MGEHKIITIKKYHKLGITHVSFIIYICSNILTPILFAYKPTKEYTNTNAKFYIPKFQSFNVESSHHNKINIYI